jgi:exo-beta-1,3-glucanase (GH17 family)
VLELLALAHTLSLSLLLFHLHLTTHSLTLLSELDEVPPAHRASIYSDPFNDGSSQSTPPPAQDSMNPGANARPPHNQYNRMAEPGMAAGAGAAAGAAGYGAYRGAQQPYVPEQSYGGGGGGGYAGYPPNNGYGQGGGYSNGGYGNGGGGGYTPQSTDGMTADQLWAMENGGGSAVKETNYQYQEPAPTKSNKKWWWIIGAIVVICAIVAVVVAVVLTQTKKNDSGSKSGSGSGDGTSIKDPNDPSNFDKDERLHQVFWGMAYQPDGAIPPMCGATLDAVIRDMQIVSQMTTRLRLYGANCNMTALVLEAIKQTKVDITIYPAIYIDSNTQAYEDQTNAILDAFQTYGVDHVEGLAVGNEWLLNQANVRPTGSKYLKDVQTLLGYVNEVKTKVQALGLSKTLPIGTGDAGSLFSTALAEGVDFYMANVHPWFGNVPVDQAAGWTWEYFMNNDVVYSQQVANQPAMYIAETGWPTKFTTPQGDDTGQTSGNPPSDATEAQLQTFLDSFVCQANTNQTHYFFFEPFDQEWKEPLYGGVEPYW